MIKLLLSCVLAIASFAPAQTYAPIIDSAPYLNGVLSTHADGSMTLAVPDGNGGLVVQSFVAAGGQSVQTSWVDQAGLTQTVTTEIPDGGSEARRRALLNHKLLVQDMKRVFPPADPPSGG